MIDESVLSNPSKDDIRKLRKYANIMSIMVDDILYISTKDAFIIWNDDLELLYAIDISTQVSDIRNSEYRIFSIPYERIVLLSYFLN